MAQAYARDGAAGALETQDHRAPGQTAAHGFEQQELARPDAAVLDAGGELYVWTVDELPRLRALEALGVTGVVTNDPRLFSRSGT